MLGGSAWGSPGPDPGGRLGGLAMEVSRPNPRGRWGSGQGVRGVSRPRPGRRLGGLARGCPGPDPEGGSRPRPVEGVSQYALRQTPPPPQQTATAADGTHHTGMHSSFL